MTFTTENLTEFKKLYEKNSHNPTATFKFEGRLFLVGYAKYLIQFLEKQPLHDDVDTFESLAQAIDEGGQHGH